MRSSLRYWVIAALLAANLVVGVLSLYFSRAVNARYAALFEDGVPAIYQLRTLTREVTGVQRLARRVITPEHEPAWAELPARMNDAREQLAVRVGDVGAMAIFQRTPHAAAIQAASREYDGEVRRFLAFAGENRLTEAAEFNLLVLRPCHDRFQQVIDHSADFVEAQGRDLRDRYARESRFFGGVSLAFASVPIVALSAGILVMTVLIGLLILVVINPRSDRHS
jgi:hypothetical protein